MKSRCAVCGARAVQRHHVIAAQHLRRWARSQEWTKKERPRRTQALLTDPRNLMAVCVACHMSHENYSRRMARAQVPDAAWEFARELGDWATVRLERDYPLHDDDAGAAAADGA